MIFLAPADARAVGEAVAPRLHLPAHIIEKQQLHIVERMLLLRRDEMAHQRVDLQPVEQAEIEIGEREAEPVHAGVDHHVAGAAARRLPAGDLLRAVEHRTGAGRKRDLHILRPHAVQHAHGKIVAQILLQRQRLGPGGDEKVAAPRIGKVRQHLPRAQAIAIGLDRRPACRRSALLPQPGIVGEQRAAIELQPQRRKMGRSHRRSSFQQARVKELMHARTAFSSGRPSASPLMVNSDKHSTPEQQ